MVAQCGEICGWVTALAAALAFGSYGVPMKGEASTRVDVDPLVFQTFKSFMCFAMSWLVLLFGVQPSFTPWGIVSAIFWVPGGTAGIYAVRRAGLAISVGIWSSVIVFVSFIWGIVIFREKVRSTLGAAAAAALLCTGLWGISFFSSPDHQKSHRPELQQEAGQETAQKNEDTYTETSNLLSKNVEQDVENTLTDDSSMDEYQTLDVEHFPHSGAPPFSEKVVTIFGIHVTQYILGIFMAVLNGLLAATILVPLHYAGPTARGLPYTISFGIGAIIVTALMWIIRYVYHVYRLGSYVEAYDALPSFHLRVMWRPGCLAGMLYSIGNISGILCVTALGDFMGYSLIQSSMVISGLWGIFWYQEVTGTDDIVGWLLAAFVTLSGILWLSYEHVR